MNLMDMPTIHRDIMCTTYCGAILGGATISFACSGSTNRGDGISSACSGSANREDGNDKIESNTEGNVEGNTEGNTKVNIKDNTEDNIKDNTEGNVEGDINDNTDVINTINAPSSAIFSFLSLGPPTPPFIKSPINTPIKDPFEFEFESNSYSIPLQQLIYLQDPLTKDTIFQVAIRHQWPGLVIHLFSLLSMADRHTICFGCNVKNENLVHGIMKTAIEQPVQGQALLGLLEWILVGCGPMPSLLSVYDPQYAGPIPLFHDYEIISNRSALFCHSLLSQQNKDGETPVQLARYFLPAIQLFQRYFQQYNSRMDNRMEHASQSSFFQYHRFLPLLCGGIVTGSILSKDVQKVDVHKVDVHKNTRKNVANDVPSDNVAEDILSDNVAEDILSKDVPSKDVPSTSNQTTSIHCDAILNFISLYPHTICMIDPVTGLLPFTSLLEQQPSIFVHLCTCLRTRFFAYYKQFECVQDQMGMTIIQWAVWYHCDVAIYQLQWASYEYVNRMDLYMNHLLVYAARSPFYIHGDSVRGPETTVRGPDGISTHGSHGSHGFHGSHGSYGYTPPSPSKKRSHEWYTSILTQHPELLVQTNCVGKNLLHIVCQFANHAMLESILAVCPPSIVLSALLMRHISSTSDTTPFHYTLQTMDQHPSIQTQWYRWFENISSLSQSSWYRQHHEIQPTTTNFIRGATTNELYLQFASSLFTPSVLRRLTRQLTPAIAFGQYVHQNKILFFLLASVPFVLARRDPEVQDTPLIMACRNQNVYYIRQVLPRFGDYCDIPAQNQRNESCFSACATNRMVSVLKQHLPSHIKSEDLRIMY